MDLVQTAHVKTQCGVIDVEPHSTGQTYSVTYEWEKALGFIANDHLDLNISQSLLLSLNIQSNISTNIEVTYLCDTDKIDNEANENFSVRTSKCMADLSEVEKAASFWKFWIGKIFL